jgi:hypothetical protein
MNFVPEFLRLPIDYCRTIGGLHWSSTGDAVVSASGNTFVFSAQLGIFLEGFTSSHRLIHLGHLLHLLHLLGYGEKDLPPSARILSAAFKHVGRPLRNAGALCALLCRGVPPVAGLIDSSLVCRCLASDPLMVELGLHWRWEYSVGQQPTAEDPDLSAEEFQAIVLHVLNGFRIDELHHWLRHGRGPNEDAGQRIAQEIAVAKPRTLEGILADLSKRQRLAGAVPFVAQLVGALALPPRRLDHRQLPMGGYADVATRGHPEQLLPSQFAVEDLEFVRRFAEHELLYFRREEPHARRREELVVLLDQGVRTWGDVRIMLSAAVFAFAKLALRRKVFFHVAGTSNRGALVDPLQVDPEHLATLLESSDLSAHPGLALEAVLENQATTDRDIVLLTHPRNLGEVDVMAAALRVAPGTRLFAVGVEAEGDGQLSELKHGVAVKVSRFRVDPKQIIVPPEVAPLPTRHLGDSLPCWKGDVEPMAFPFRLGLTGRIRGDLLAFDDAGEWLLAGTQNGMLHAFRTDGASSEILPLPMLNKIVVQDFRAILGVAAGFVVVGELRGILVAAHYDWATRTCRIQELGKADDVAECHYYPKWRSVVAVGRDRSVAVDLAESGRPTHMAPESGRGQRAVEEAERERREGWPFHERRALEWNRLKSKYEFVLEFEPRTGLLQPCEVSPAWQPCTPLADGKPLLRDCTMERAKLSANTLAVVYFDPRQRLNKLLALRGPTGVPVWECGVFSSTAAFALSRDGRLLARQSKPERLEVRDLTDVTRCVSAEPGRFHSRLVVGLSDQLLGIAIGKRIHLLDWSNEILEHGRPSTSTSLRSLLEQRRIEQDFPPTKVYWIVPHAGERSNRFNGIVAGPLVILVDKLGQLIVKDRSDRLVCIFFFYRNQFAAWMPDGTRYGPAALIGGAATPNALERIGMALNRAWRHAYDGSS